MKKLYTPILPINDEVVLKVGEALKQSKGGIQLITGDSSLRQEEQRDFGQVVAISPTAFKHIFDGKCRIKVGQVVVYQTYTGCLRKVEKDNGVEFFRIVKDSDIKGISVEHNDLFDHIPSEFVSESIKELDKTRLTTEMANFNKLKTQ